MPLGPASKVISIAKPIKGIYKRKPLTDKQIDDLLKPPQGPDKRTEAQKRAAQAIYKSTFREP
jgi:hypothetical protein|tara:strand:- start:103 stop:291 length:189 start_codon:yes stop_codon:yes gene_type:complete